MRGTARHTTGFTIVELLMVAIIGAVALTAAVRLIVGQQRSHTVQVGRETVQESLRTGMSVLIGEFRELSVSEGDIVAMASDSVVIRVAHSLGFVCDLVRGATPSFDVRHLGSDIAATDSFTVLAANRPGLWDDVWVQGRPTTVGAVNCPDGSAAQRLNVQPMSAALIADTVRVGAPVRKLEYITYGLYQDGTRWYLGSRINQRPVDMLVGPLLPRASGGLALEYLENDGDPTTTPADVARIRITLRARSQARTAPGAVVADSLTALVAVRN